MPQSNLLDISVHKAKRLAILGSTGSIGSQTLEVVRRFPDRFRVEVLSCGSNVELLISQALEFRPSLVVVGDETLAATAATALDGSGVAVRGGEQAIVDAVDEVDIDLVVAATVGFAGLPPVVRAAEKGINIALANKESLVVAGAYVKSIIDRTGSKLIPVDSEHSAIFQCLEGEALKAVDRLILTASGGPFWGRPRDTFDLITKKEALDHPNWAMGEKITIDSATMMNKGLELIEAHWLFGIDAEDIVMVVHPQSIVHSMIEFVDGSTMAQLSQPDMQLPIQYALGYPERLPSKRGRVDWSKIQQLDFEPPDPAKFPCITLAYQALEAGGAAPVILNAANEAAVSLFLEERISFVDIPSVIQDAMSNVEHSKCHDLDAIVDVHLSTLRHVAELKRATAN